jgi:hypothetical protein
MTRLSTLFILALIFAPAAPLAAQNTNQSQLRLVVVDETGAGIPSATIVVTPVSGPAITFSSDEHGIASSPSLPVGTAKVHVEFEGFEPYEGTLNLRRGALNQTVTLKIAGLKEEVVVSDTTATDDRRGNSLSTTLEQSEIDELPEDPDELADVLTAMAGGSGAVFQVNGFRGGRLPSRDEIRQIRFRTNSFAADNHDAGRTQIEIITRPNVREWSGNGSFNYRSDSMNARNALRRRRRRRRTATSISARVARSSPARRRFASVSTAAATSRPTRSSHSTRTAIVWANTFAGPPKRRTSPPVSNTR